MEMDKGALLKRVTIDCPVCTSRNDFRDVQSWAGLACDDCGFALTGESAPSRAAAGLCVFCGSNRFYRESPLSLSILGRDSVCYVCEAHYKDTQVGTPDPSYSDAARAYARQTPWAAEWEERVKEYSTP